MKIKRKLLEKIKEKLLGYDPEIVEIVQFGSSVYLPELAQDLDLLVYTKHKKGDIFDYLGALDGLDLPEIDLILKEPGNSLDGLKLGVLGANRVIYGEGTFAMKSAKKFDPSFDEAWNSLKAGRVNLTDGSETKDRGLKHERIRTAFNKLSHAARMASLANLAKEELGWKGVEEALPSEFKKKFGDIFKTLHVEYFYNGNYPQTAEEEFEKWEEKVKNYIKRLEEGGKSGNAMET